MKIYSLDSLRSTIVPLLSLKEKIEKTIHAVEGDFRQEEILLRWAKIFETQGDIPVCVMTFRARVSSGTYIRVLAQKMGESLGVPSLALSIKRTSIGTIDL